MRTQIVTPKGTAQYPKLRTPEYFEGAEVGYTIQMSFSKEDTDKLLQQLEAELEAAKGSSEFKGKNGQVHASAPKKTKMVTPSLNSRPKPTTKPKQAKLYSALFQFSTPKATASKATLGMAACVESASRSTPITNQRSTVV